MPTTILSGVVDDQDILSNERVIDMRDTIDMLETDSTQFSTALMKVASREANSTKVEWLEDRLYPRVSALASSATSATSSLDVTTDTGTYFNVGDVVRICTTGEAVEVLSVATDTLGVTRSIGSVAAATAQTGAELVIVGNANLQGATAPTPKVTKRVANYNYTQIHRHSWSFVRSLTQSKLYGGSEPNKERKKKAIEHKRALEATFFFGARDIDTGGSEPQTFSGGLVEYISTNLHDPSGQMTSAELDTFLATDLQYGSMQNKVLFVSPTFARVVSAYAADNWVRSTPNDKVYGIKVDAFISGAYGYGMPVFVKREWGEFATTSSQYGSWGFVVDMDAVTMRPLQSTVLLRNRQAPDADRITEEYLTEVSLEVLTEKKHAIIKNVTS